MHPIAAGAAAVVLALLPTAADELGIEMPKGLAVLVLIAAGVLGLWVFVAAIRSAASSEAVQRQVPGIGRLPLVQDRGFKAYHRAAVENALQPPPRATAPTRPSRQPPSLTDTLQRLSYEAKQLLAQWEIVGNERFLKALTEWEPKADTALQECGADALRARWQQERDKPRKTVGDYREYLTTSHDMFYEAFMDLIKTELPF